MTGFPSHLMARAAAPAIHVPAPLRLVAWLAVATVAQLVRAPGLPP
jgi:hypothetical protein